MTFGLADEAVTEGGGAKLCRLQLCPHSVDRLAARGIRCRMKPLQQLFKDSFAQGWMKGDERRFLTSELGVR